MNQLPSFRSSSRFWNRLQVLSLGLSILSLSLTSSVFAQERGQIHTISLKTLTVTGRGMESISTTISQVQLGVEVQRKTANEAQEEAARRSAAVVELLRSRNVEKLQTTGIRLNPIYSYDNNKQTLTGYIATNTVSFKVDNLKAGAIVDEAVKVGATRIDGISFTATETAIATAQKQALREATQDAREQADAVLSALNLTPKDIVSVQINGATPLPPPLPVQVSELRVKSDATTPVVGGEQQVEASVTLQISY